MIGRDGFASVRSPVLALAVRARRAVPKFSRSAPPTRCGGLGILAALCAGLVLPACSGSQAGEAAGTPPMATAGEEGQEGAGEQAATLDVMSGQPTEIKLDGKPIGKTPISGYKVAPGTHDVTFMFTDKDTPTLSVTLGPGEAQTVKLDPPPPIRESGGKPPPKEK